MGNDIHYFIQEFKNRIDTIYHSYINNLQNRIQDPNVHFSISDLEESLTNVNRDMLNTYIAITSHILSSIDESDIIYSIKAEYRSKGINLVIKDRKERSIITTQGKLNYTRTILRPKTDEDELKLMNLENRKSIAPLDYFLEIDSLPFKITPNFMLEIAHYGIRCKSYLETKNILHKIYGPKINHEIIRDITNMVGKSVHEYESKKADEIIIQFENGDYKLTNKEDKILFMEMDGSFINTRLKNSDGTTWSENKLCLIFNSDDIKEYRDKNGELQYRINNIEYISFFGKADEFKKYVLYLAVKNKYNIYKDMVILSDGALWIRTIRDKFFPHAQQILDIYHLYENTSNFLKLIYSDEKKISHYEYKWFELLEQGEWKKVLKDLEPYKNKTMPKGIVNLYTYINNNCDIIDYPLYRQKYYFIGSGAIESGNKYVVQSRLKLAGMRWDKKMAQYILTLRCKECSNTWKEVENIFENYLIYNNKFKQ